MSETQDIKQWRDIPARKPGSFWFFHATLDVGSGWIRISESSHPAAEGLLVVRADDPPVELFQARLMPPGLPRRGLLLKGRDTSVHANVSRLGRALPKILEERGVPFIRKTTWFSIGLERLR